MRERMNQSRSSSRAAGHRAVEGFGRRGQRVRTPPERNRASPESSPGRTGRGDRPPKTAWTGPRRSMTSEIGTGDHGTVEGASGCTAESGISGRQFRDPLDPVEPPSITEPFGIPWSGASAGSSVRPTPAMTDSSGSRRVPIRYKILIRSVVTVYRYFAVSSGEIRK